MLEAVVTEYVAANRRNDAAHDGTFGYEMVPILIALADLQQADGLRAFAALVSVGAVVCTERGRLMVGGVS